MSGTVFLAGATGAIGRRLTPLLAEAGYTVYGLTRSPAKARALEARGVRAIVGDVYDAAALRVALAAVQPDIVVHQLTDLPQSVTERGGAAAMERNARVRVEGTRNLVDAALHAGVPRIVAQSIAFAYAPGGEPHVETDPLDPARDSVIALERLVLASPPILGTVLRFGSFYGPGTWYAEANGNCPVHVDAAAHATLLALESAARGTFNVAEERGYLSAARAREELGWDPDFRCRR